MKNITPQSVFFQLASLDHLIDQHASSIKSLCSSNMLNPQKLDSFVDTLSKDQVICLESPNHLTMLILQYLLLFRDPSNDRFIQQTEAHLNKQKDPLLKKTIQHTLKIIKKVVSRNLRSFFNFNSSVLTHTKQQIDCPFQKSVNSNLNNLEINSHAILSTIDFLQTHFMEFELQNKVQGWINESLKQIASNKRKAEQSPKKYQEDEKTNEPYFYEFGNLTEQILVFLPCKNLSNNLERPQRQILDGEQEKMENGEGCKLMIFPNKKTLINFAFSMKATEQQTEKAGNRSFQQEISTQAGSKISERSTKNKLFQPLLEQSVSHSSVKDIAGHNAYKRYQKQEFQVDSLPQKIIHLVTFGVLFGVIALHVFESLYPENPFAIEGLQFLSELSKILDFATFNILQTFSMFSLRLLYLGDWNFNSYFTNH